MKQEIYRDKSNVFLGNQLLEETETIIYYSDGSFEVVPETVLDNEEDNY